MATVYNTTLQRGTTFNRTFISRLSLGQSATPLFIATGNQTFFIQSGLAITVGQRVRATSLSEPQSYQEGVVVSYTGTALVLNIDLIAGDPAFQYSDWQMAGPNNLTGTTVAGSMSLLPNSCVSRARSSISFSVTIAVDPTTGQFAINLSPTQTGALTLGDYDFFVVVTASNAVDKMQIVSGVITVVDPG